MNRTIAGLEYGTYETQDWKKWATEQRCIHIEITYYTISTLDGKHFLRHLLMAKQK